jgi:hypothetical protein
MSNWARRSILSTKQLGRDLFLVRRIKHTLQA